MSVQAASQQICCPCYQWEAEELHIPAKGEEPESFEYNFFTSAGSSTYTNKDTFEDLRAKFSILTAVSIPLGLFVRLPTRCALLLSGSWVLPGLEKAKTAWTKECLQRFQAGQEPPPNFLYGRIVVWSIACQFVQDVVKCATLPLAFVAMTFAALWGLINPLDGRKLFGDIEELWSIDIPEWILKDCEFVFAAANCLAFCMKSNEAKERANIFQYLPYYHPQTLRSLHRSLKVLWSQGLAEGLSNEMLAQWKRAIRTISKHDREEIGRNNQIIYDQKREALRGVFEGVLIEYRNRNDELSAQEQPDKESAADIAEAIRRVGETLDWIQELLAPQAVDPPAESLDQIPGEDHVDAIF